MRSRGSLDADRLNSISGTVIDSSIEVHSALGPGLLEGPYEKCLAHELRSRGLRVEQQVPIPILYKGLRLTNTYRIDLLVEEEIVVELKIVKKLHELHQAQLLSYLKLMKKRVGLLINFHSLHLREGIKRMVNEF
ncbi:MAG TPA: GxxExxY protein [Gemmatimonadaceae bacterium]|jgi:GxxExxY protein